MQDAWVTDQGGSTPGSWENIGYEAPASKNLEYSDDNDWTAEPKGSWAPACSGNTTWNVDVTVASGKATYQASDNCPNLTPNFKNIGTSN